jgi:hypothetical protein
LIASSTFGNRRIAVKVGLRRTWAELDRHENGRNRGAAAGRSASRPLLNFKRRHRPRLFLIATPRRWR